MVAITDVASSAAPVGQPAAGPVRSGPTMSTSEAHEVDVAALPDIAAPSQGTANLGARRMDGSQGPKPAVAVAKPAASNAAETPSVVTPNLIKQNFDGTLASQSSCGCQPPDSNGAVSTKNIVEADNVSLQTWTKSPSPGTLTRRISLNSFFGTADSLSDPRVFYDNAWNRWVLIVIIVPSPSNAPPAWWMAASTSSNPNGTWFTYRAGISGLGTVSLLDYPMVGMDSDAIAMSTNNFSPGACTGGFCYTNSTALSWAKQRFYNGLGIGVPVFFVDWATHPAIVEGIPQAQDAKLYLVASLIPYGQSGFDVFEMANTAKPGATTLTFIGNPGDPLNLSTPPNCAPQPGGGNCLDALDGRLQSAPKQYGGRVWWTRATGFPVVEYGAITIAGLTNQSAVAYLQGSSNDWNPSIGVGVDGSGNQRVFLNWAVDDPSAGLQVSMRTSGLGPADPVQNLIGIGTTLWTGSHGNDFRFGDYSSVSVDPSKGNCTAVGKGALLVNEVFSGGQWVNHISRVCFA